MDGSWEAMAQNTRERMIAAALRLLATRGLQGASLAEVLDLAEAPRGSFYHHFPGGKDELIASAIAQAGGRSLTVLAGLDGEPPAVIAERFFASWRDLLIRSQFRAGCSVLAVTIAADSPELIERSASVFDAWQERLADLFAQGGLPRNLAEAHATTLIAVSEGAVVMSRAKAGIEPFDTVARHFTEQLRMIGTAD
jgi:TetR/AcrR family transcriptional regulator, lmrAB and yxaGH operons repressor